MRLFLGDDDGKEDDAQSVASVGEEYEPISDDELDEILADSQKKEDQQDEEKITGTRSYLYGEYQENVRCDAPIRMTLQKCSLCG